MRVLMLTDSMDAGGAQTHIITLAKGLSKRGHTVFVISGGGRSVKELRTAGAKHVTLPLDSHSLIALTKAYLQILVFCSRAKVDVIHAHARIAASIGARVASALSIPFVTTAHARFSITPLKRCFSRWGTLCAAVSEDIKQYLCDNYSIPPDNISVIENGIDTDVFSPCGTKSNKQIRLTCISRMDKDCAKAALALCAIAPKLYARFPTLSITLAGGGDALNTVKKHARKAQKISGMNIQVLGHVSDIPKLLKDTDIFVGVSRAALEAMSCGVPTVIAGNEGFFGTVNKNNFFDAKIDNFCAREYTKMTTNELYREIHRICSMDLESRIKLGISLRNQILLSNSAERMIGKVLKLYQDAQERVPRRDPDIVLCGYYGCGNTGDDALLKGAVLRARALHPKFSISALTANGKLDEESFGITCIRRKSPLSVLRAISNAKLFVFGGGTLLQDTTSKRSLVYYLFLLRYAQKRGVRCELWGNGIGPLRVRLLRNMTARALRGCSYIGVRDARSGACVHALTAGACTRPVIENDLALGTRSSDDERISFLLKRLGFNKDTHFAAVAIRGRKFRKMPISEKREISRMTKAIRCAKEKGLEILFIEFCSKEDKKLTKLLQKRFSGKIARGLSPSDIVGIFSKARIVYASRYHALVFAKIAGTRFIPFGTDPKIISFKLNS